jgi:glutaminyl-peptide cyclotransferase
MKWSLFILTLVLFTTSCGKKNKVEIVKSLPISSYDITGSYSHDTSAYTQGLEFHNDTLIESSGIKGKSWITHGLLSTNTTNAKFHLDSNDFAEGLTILGNKLYLLTETSNKLYVFDKRNLNLLRTVDLQYKGWGLCNNGKDLIFSDGTHILTYLDTANFKIIREVPVTEYGKPLFQINEMEYVNGYIFANIYTTNFIYLIDPIHGNAIAKFDLKALEIDSKKIKHDIDYLNGIAYLKKEKQLLVTGKFWPKLYTLTISDTLVAKYFH